MGFGWSAQLAVGPIYNTTSNGYARTYYEDARAIDRAEGRVYDSGASILAGAKVAQQRRLISGYKWAFGIADVIATLCSRGPVLLGIPWYESMYATDPDGRVIVNGRQVGGHCILATGYIPNDPTWLGSYVQLVNSWGPGWGMNGVGYIEVGLLSWLLQQQGEALIADEVQPVVAKPWWWKFLPGTR